MNESFLPAINWVDIVVLIFLARGGYIGLERGFSIELFKSAATVGACVVSTIYYNRLGEWFDAHSFLSLQIAQFLAFFTLFFTLLLIFKIVRELLFKVMQLGFALALEKWGGLIFGLTRSLIFASLFLFSLTLLPVDYLKKSVEGSYCGRQLLKVSPKVSEFVLMFKPKIEEHQ
ncbi:MAG: CvpA family protein [Candidatus Omnitrophota bacterium]